MNVETSHYNRSLGEVQVRTYDLSVPADCIRYVARERVAGLGGYELMLIDYNGSMLCSGCVRERFEEELRDCLEGYDWYKEAYIITDGDFDGPIACENCNKDFGVSVDN